MGIETALLGAAIAGAVGTGYSIYSGERQRSQQKRATNQAEQAARRQERQAEQDMNRARTRTPDTTALLEQAAQSSGGTTMLTGPSGVDPNQLSLGKNTLLGG